MNVQQGVRQPVLSYGTMAERMAATGLALALLAGAAAALSGFGTRWGWWNFMSGLTLLRAAAIGGGIAAVLSLLGGIIARPERRRSIFSATAAGILIGLVVAGVPLSWAYRAGKLPMIHDITTDLDNPPQFKAVLALRQDAANPATYGGPEIAVQQASAYPDIQPLTLPESPQMTFNKALLTAMHMGWRIVDSSIQEGRIEAVATTFWFGLKDDIVIRVAPVPDGSRVDVRSTSRVGRSDVGTNAARVRAFLARLNAPGGQ